MGTVFTIDIRDDGSWEDAIGDVVRWLHRVDGVFSTWKPQSDISRIRRGELRVHQADPDVATVLDLCAEAQTITGGAFSAMPLGTLDPTGLVKGWAIERASALLREHGTTNHAVNGGGDLCLAGEAAPGRSWAVGISDPHDRAKVLTVVSGRDLAVATSGTAERGAHIIDPFTRTAAATVASATVVGPSITYADAFATAVAVLGPDGARWMDGIADYECLIVTSGGAHHASRGWHRQTTPAAA
jgi:thiamine biosynthesis lipoprotein